MWTSVNSPSLPTSLLAEREMPGIPRLHSVGTCVSHAPNARTHDKRFQCSVPHLPVSLCLSLLLQVPVDNRIRAEMSYCNSQKSRFPPPHLRLSNLSPIPKFKSHVFSLFPPFLDSFFAFLKPRKSLKPVETQHGSNHKDLEISSTLAWKIPWAEEPGRLQSMGSQRVRDD